MTDDPSILTAYDFECTDLFGKSFPLQQFKGRPLLIVNTASLCGFSTQYNGLEAIWQRHRGAGIIVISVPSNDFGQQEPGNSAAIASLCSTKFGVTFPVLQKTSVSGLQIHPLFQWIGKEGGFMAKPRWNFYKYIIGRDGRLKDWFSFITPPSANRFDRAIRRALKEN